MKKLNPLLLCDFYKTVHSEQYPEGIERIVSYYTPRMTRLINEDKLVMFGLQGFIQEYLVDYFDDYFFAIPLEEVLEQYNRILSITLGSQNYTSEKIKELHNIGYLPLEINALPEGTRTPMHVPMIEITNTHKDFAWLVNSIETLLSTSTWHSMISANVGYRYRQIVNHYYNLTVEDSVPKNKALGDFSMRGQESLESATKSSAGWLLSFLNTATIPAIYYLENYYDVKLGKDEIGYGSPSTEHSVMCSNTAVDGDEITMIKRLLTETYPNSNFSFVADSYDYWNVVNNILPQCKKEIEEHNGVLMVRGDSGDPVEIVTKTVFSLWKNFGGTTNSKGYKVLNPKVKAIYGDSITSQRAESIYEILKNEGFSCENVSLGVGSFSMQASEELGALKPFTRDTFGIAVKATYAEVNGKEIPIFKNPKTDTGNFKKSQKGCCLVYLDENSELNYKDELTWSEVYEHTDSQYVNYFTNGIVSYPQNLNDIRSLLHDNKF